MKNKDKQYLFSYIKNRYPLVKNSQLNKMLIEITGNKRPITNTITRLRNHPDVFLRFYERRREAESNKLPLASKLIEKIDLLFYNL
jgi:hypothetical protein